MRPGRFFWKLFLGNALLMAIVLIVSIWMIADELDSAYVQDLTRQLTAQAELIRNEVKDRFDAGHTEELNKIARSGAAHAGLARHNGRCRWDCLGGLRGGTVTHGAARQPHKGPLTNGHTLEEVNKPCHKYNAPFVCQVLL